MNISESDTMSRQSAGGWFISKWQRRLSESGFAYVTVATQMRKQGIPLEVALPVLTGASCRGLAPEHLLGSSEPGAGT